MKNSFQTLGAIFKWSRVRLGFGWWSLQKNRRITEW